MGGEDRVVKNFPSPVQTCTWHSWLPPLFLCFLPWALFWLWNFKNCCLISLSPFPLPSPVPPAFPHLFQPFWLLLHSCTMVNLSLESVQTRSYMPSTKLKSAANTRWKRRIMTAVSNLHVVFPACLAAKIMTRPGQVGACNGYILEGDELETLLNTCRDLRLSMERKAEKQ